MVIGRGTRGSSFSLLATALFFSACEDRDRAFIQSPSAQSASHVAPRAQPVKSFGIYQWNKHSDYEQGLMEEISTIGITPSYAMYFIDRNMPFPSQIVKFNATRNIRTIVTQELCTYGGDNFQVLDSILAGEWDGYFRGVAKSAKKFGQPVYYRFGYEMNGDWVVWGEQPEKFVQVWRRVHDLFREEGAFNVQWVFSPNVIWEGRTFEQDILPYYPGDAFVDIVGLDGYNFGDRHSRFHQWRTFEEVFGASIRGMKKYFPHKTFWIAEIGCADGPGKAEWIQDFFAYFSVDPDVKVFIWFNEDKQYAGEPNWRIDSDAVSLDRFRRWAIHSNSITSYSLPLAQGYGPQRTLRPKIL